VLPNCLEYFRGLKGQESIAQALAWVCISNGSALKGRQKIVLRRYGIRWALIRAGRDKPVGRVKLGCIEPKLKHGPLGRRSEQRLVLDASERAVT
jgi:hypothetical protein